MAIISPPASVSGVITFQWIDKNGVTRNLSQPPSLFVSKGSRGLGMAPKDLAMDKIPALPGSLLRHTATPPREIGLPVTVQTSSFAGMIAVMNDLFWWFDTGDEEGHTPGYLRVTRPDDEIRKIACYYKGGLDGDLQDGGPTILTSLIELTAPDPYPTADSPEVRSYGQADINTGVQKIVINPGELDAYPIWTVTGPITGITINHDTSGEYIQLTADTLTVPAGHTLLIDHRPPTIRTTLPILYDGASSRYSYLTAPSSFFTFPPGENRFKLWGTGTSSATKYDLSFLPRYVGILR